MHAEQTALPLGAWVPEGHAVHVLRSDEGMWPSSHAVQLALPTAPFEALRVPFGQAMHASSCDSALAFASA